MKAFIFTLFCLYALIQLASAQVLYGTTSDGGKYGGGTICSYNPATQALNAVKRFYEDGAIPYGSLTPAADGKLYGTTEGGGWNGSGGRPGFGTIYSYDAATGIYTQVASFDGYNGAYPNGGLLQASDGKLYGMTHEGEYNETGEIFSFDPATSIITDVYDFSFNDGVYPYGGLIQAADGKLYGMTSRGGKYGYGVIFSFDPITSTYNQLHDFDVTTGATPYGNLMQAANGKLYGMTSKGGGYQGVIFSFDPVTLTITKLYSFDGVNGANPQKSLIQTADGNFYGTTRQGGNKDFGVIFSFNPSTLTYKKLYDYNGPDGSSPYGNLFQATDGKLYGLTEWGGVNKYGVIFSFNLSDSTYTKLFDFGYTYGEHPVSSFVQASDGKLYAVATKGGASALDKGVLFSYDISTDAYNKVRDFGTNQDGSALYGSLCKAKDGNLYGTTNEGGSKGHGVMFSFNPFTGTYTKLYDFDDTDGIYPQGGLIQATDGKLYGMTHNGGIKGYGVIYSFDPSTSTYTKLYDFDYTNGAWPQANLMQASDGKLYGMTPDGGNNSYGEIFSFNPWTLTLSKLFDFDSKNGAYPNGSLTQATDGMLYGMTGGRGKNYGGVIFSIDISTYTFTKLYDFNDTDGANPQGSLIQATNGKLYGMTVSGGTKIANNYFNGGVIFSFDPASSTYKKLYDFDGINGAAPWGSLLQASDGKLYGMTEKGGSNYNSYYNYGFGVAFSYDITADSNNYQKLADFTGDNGAHPFLTSFVEISCTPKTLYKDADGDGYGNQDSTIQTCTLLNGYVADSTDCNDQDSSIHPGAVEICDGKDNNCNGQVDENCPVTNISIGDAITFEGNSGYKQMHFSVSRSSAASNTIKVNYTVNGTATAPEDYEATKGMLTFMPGEKEQIITVLIKGDQQAEYPELFKVQLSKPVDATISKGEGIGIIIDDDLSISTPLTVDGNSSTIHSIAVTPNPASSIVNVQLKGFTGNTVLQLLSPQGRLVKEMKLQLKGIGNQQLNVSDLSGGTYLLSVTDEMGKRQTVKLIIVH